MTVRVDLKRTGDAGVDGNFRRVASSLGELDAVALLGGVLVDTSLVDATDTLILHQLDRAWRGWSVVNVEGASATGRIMHMPSTTASPYDTSRHLRLRATGHGATITVRLWVF